MPWAQNLESFLKVLVISATCVIAPIAVYLAWDWVWFVLTLSARKLQNELPSMTWHAPDKLSQETLGNSAEDDSNNAGDSQDVTAQEEVPPTLMMAAEKRVARPESLGTGGTRSRRPELDLERGIAA